MTVEQRQADADPQTI